MVLLQSVVSFSLVIIFITDPVKLESNSFYAVSTFWDNTPTKKSEGKEPKAQLKQLNHSSTEKA